MSAVSCAGKQWRTLQPLVNFHILSFYAVLGNPAVENFVCGTEILIFFFFFLVRHLNLLAQSSSSFSFPSLSFPPLFFVIF
jgi:hypothetical protein